MTQDNFTAPLKEFAELLNLNMQTVVRAIAVDLHRRITLRTPVDTGRARSSWVMTVGAPSSFVPPEPPAGTKGKKVKSKQSFENVFTGGLASITEIPPAVQEIDGTKPVYIVSNLDYIYNLEQGTSRQAPLGMVTISIVELESEVESLMDSVIKK